MKSGNLISTRNLIFQPLVPLVNWDWLVQWSEYNEEKPRLVLRALSNHRVSHLRGSQWISKSARISSYCSWITRYISTIMIFHWRGAVTDHNIRCARPVRVGKVKQQYFYIPGLSWRKHFVYVWRFRSNWDMIWMVPISTHRWSKFLHSPLFYLVLSFERMLPEFLRSIDASWFLILLMICQDLKHYHYVRSF